MRRIVRVALACLLILAIDVSVQAQITRTMMPVDMLNIPTNASNSPYPITARSGAGSTCSAATLNTAITAIGSTRRTLVLVPNDGAGTACTWTLEANVTTNANTTLLIAAPVSVNTGMALTINGPHESLIGPDWYSGAGTVTFSEIPWGSAEAFSTAFSNYVRSGGLHGTSGSMTSPSFATRAWVSGRDINEPSTTITYAAAANDVCWTIISSDTDGITGWTRVGTTAYYDQCEGDTTPNQPTLPANSSWLMRITITGSVIASVRDLRTTLPIRCTSPEISRLYNVACPPFNGVLDGITDDTTALTSALAAATAAGGGEVIIPYGSLRTTQRTFITSSNITLSARGEAEILFQPTTPAVDDRALVIHAGDSPAGFSALRPINAAIAIGAGTFTSTNGGADVSDLVAGDWLTVEERDTGIGDIVIFDWVQVASVAGSVVTTYAPFRTAFPGTHCTGAFTTTCINFRRITNVVRNVTIRDLTIRTTNTTNSLVGISVGIAREVRIYNTTSQPARGNAYYSYRSAAVSLEGNNQRRNLGQSSEFAATVDLSLIGNNFSTVDTTANTASLTLDFGTAFFTVVGNRINNSANIGVQLLYGVRHGIFSSNLISFVRRESIDPFGISSLGSTSVVVANNVLSGGLLGGGGSTGIGFGDTSTLTVNILSAGNIIGPNVIANFDRAFLTTVSASDLYFDAHGPQAGTLRLLQRLALGAGVNLPDTNRILALQSTTGANLMLQWIRTGIGNWYAGPLASDFGRWCVSNGLETTERLCVDSVGYVGMQSVTAAILLAASPANFTMIGCSDCTVSTGANNTCNGGGAGALAVRIGGVWRCFNLQN